MNCPFCSRTLTRHVENHHYAACGLDNVVLEKVEIYRCECGEEMVSIPAMPDLHTLIGTNIVAKKSLLNGKEIRFLRKNMGLAAKKLAAIIGVDNATVSRWENDNQSISGPNDRLLRLYYLFEKGLHPEEINVQKDFPEIINEQTESPELLIPYAAWAKDKNACAA